LVQPDYNKKCTLTIAAVLSQEGKPVTSISKTIPKAEKIYATNKKEFLAILWAFKNFRNSLYGVNNIEIYTDHPNIKIKSVGIHSLKVILPK